MIIVGGSYNEFCDWPEWNRILGPGGRAALAVSSVSPGSVLHTCAPADWAADINASMAAAGIEAHIRTTAEKIAFVYKHPLTKPPAMEPVSPSATMLGPLDVEGDTVLAFGLIEGEVRVSADRAVFELSSNLDKSITRKNVKSLALICTKNDLPDVFTPGADVRDPVTNILSANNADLMVVRGELGGAALFMGDTRHDVPAYISDKWFKIGAGNVFCAMFAHYWGEKKLQPDVAADLASRSAAFYAGALVLPMVGPDELPTMDSFDPAAVGKVFIASPCLSMAQQWLLDQAISGLENLGAGVVSPYDLGVDWSTKNDIDIAAVLDGCNAVLVLADGADLPSVFAVGLAQVRRLPIVVLAESSIARKLDLWEGTDCEVANDFASAVYRTAVASARKPAA
ncbi:nucleoside 2-deoxyribosyltransferase [Pseudorhodoplanes sp.]|uniref:nucleoside 2-deoxyribosyltransferase n=1 Tax=Pseudorhodoplanes sp. TaxID=1934341 RepID=UPI003D0CCC25